MLLPSHTQPDSVLKSTPLAFQRNDLLSWLWHTLYIIYNKLWLHSEHQFMDCLYKTASVILYMFKLVPAQRLSLLPKHPSFPPKTSGVHIRTNILAPTSSVFPLIINMHVSPFTIQGHHATFHSLIHSPSVLFFHLHLCWITKAQQSRNVNSLVKGPSSNSSSSHRSFRILVPLQHCSGTTDRFVCLTPSDTR